MKYVERRLWIRRIWAHSRLAKAEPMKFVHTLLDERVRATIALLLNRIAAEREDFYGWEEVAWGDDYRYGEYGIGRGWITCAVKGFTCCFYDDGDY